ncbi:MAG TPA: sodium:proton antiporter [Methylocella sp.]|nr:sodium:proton antiporter [Methylocella sp.]
MRVLWLKTILAGLIFVASAFPALADAFLDGAELPWPLALPFAGMLLSIALGPIVVREWWHIHYEKAAAFWAFSAFASLAAFAGFEPAAAALLHSLLADYLPFILMLFALYTAAGGIVIEGLGDGSPGRNCFILALGAAMASFTGTIGASMILIRPLLLANGSRAHRAHIVVFYIFLVSNIGGALTPLGDPPLFLGFLKGVDFFWTSRHLWPATLFTVTILLFVFFLLDCYFDRREKRVVQAMRGKLRVKGAANLALIGITILAIVVSGTWRLGRGFDVLGTRVELQNLLREGLMVLVGLASLALTDPRLRATNGFDFEPIREVAYLFAGIFATIIPVMAMLQAGPQGPFRLAVAALTNADGTPNNAVYFWATGALSAFLDNAPTYLVFFQLAGGKPSELMGPLATTLSAISLGAVFMGASSYIGNAPNFMVYAIARSAGVRMPSFFTYLLLAAVFLLPLYAALTFLFLL